MPEATVTALRAARGGGDRQRLYLDGEDAAVVSGKLITAFNLHVGRRLTDDERSDLLRQAEAEEIHRRIMRLLERRDYTRAEVQRKLAQHDPGLVTEALDLFVARRLIDDRRTARELVAVRQQHRPCGKARLAHDLRRRGVAPATIRDVLAETAGSEDDDFAAAGSAAARIAGRLRGLDSMTKRRRLGAFLSRRGFSAAVISRVMRKETGSDSDDD